MNLENFMENINPFRKINTEEFKGKYPEFVRLLENFNEIYPLSFMYDVKSNGKILLNLAMFGENELNTAIKRPAKILSGDWDDLLTTAMVNGLIEEEYHPAIMEMFFLNSKRIDILKKLSHNEIFTQKIYGSKLLVGGRSITEELKEVIAEELGLDNVNLFLNHTSDKIFRLYYDKYYYDFTLDLKHPKIARNINLITIYDYQIKSVEDIDSKFLLLK